MTGNGVSRVAVPTKLFDLMVYAEALVILHGYEKIRWPDAPEWASRETWLECVPDSTEPSPSPEPVPTPS